MTESNNYHVITTDSPLFEALGLSVFTTGTMWDFLTHKDKAGVENFRYFGETSLGIPSAPSDMYFIFKADGGGNLGYWMESYDPQTNTHASKEEDKDLFTGLTAGSWKFNNKKNEPYEWDGLPDLGGDKTYYSDNKLNPSDAPLWRGPKTSKWFR